MKRQLRPMLVAVALLCAPLAWSQSSYSTYPASGDQQQAGSNNSSASGYSTYPTYSSSNDPQQQAGATESDPSQAQPQPQPQPVFTTYGSSDPQQQGASSDPTQNGSGGGAGDGLQEGSDDSSQSGVGGPQATFSHPEKLPPLNLFSDAVSHTGYSLYFAGGAVAQYVGGYYNQPGYWNSLYLGSGGINLVQSRSHLLWSLGYNAGVNETVGTIYSNYSNLNQNVNGHVIWQISRRWQFRIKDAYLYSDDPFQPFFTYLAQPQPNYPNPVIYFPQTVVEQNQGSADLTYMLGAHDTLNFYGAESFQHYLRGYQTQSSLPNFGSLWNSTTYAGGVFYQHAFSAKLSAGFGYIFTALDFGHGQSRAGTQMFQTFANYKINSRLTISGWVGPELTHTKDLVPLICLPNGCLIEEKHESYVNVAEGATLSYSAPHNNTFAVQASNSITNGGGVFGAVKYYAVTGTYARPINRNWSFAAGGLLSHSDSLSTFSGDQYLHGIQATVNFNRRFNDAWNMNAYYVFIHQVQDYYGQFGLPTTALTSGLGLTIQYAWNHSLGR